MGPSWLHRLEEGKQKRLVAASDTLLKMTDALRDPDKPYLDNHTLQSLGIKVSHVQLDGNKDTPLSKFFSPMPIKSWPASFDPDADCREFDPGWGRLHEALSIDYELPLCIHKPIDGETGHATDLFTLSELRQIE
jgi:hypothetical protein